MKPIYRLLLGCFIIWGVALNLSIVQSEEKKGETSMSISEGKIVAIEYTLTLENKEVIDTNKRKEPLSYTQGSKQIFPSLQKALEGMKVGETKKVSLAPEESYGQRIEGAVIEVSKEQIFPDVWKVDAIVQGENGAGQTFRGRIIEIKEDKAVVDLNHPLAGKNIIYEIKVLDIQDN
jgi:FKBP-type peptidyl-prolyl cis-trans isomerase 2